MPRPKLLIIIGIISVLLIFGIFWGSTKSNKNNPNTITEQKLIKDKASGDTENEVLRTVLANQEQLKSENKILKEQNNKLRQKGLENVDNMVENSKQKLHDEIQELKSAFEEKMKGQQKDIENLANRSQQNSQDTQETQMEINGAEELNNNARPRIITSVVDLSSVINEKNTKEADQSPESQTPALPSDTNNNNQTSSITPYYTIPANSTLNHVKLMTSIIGEVPVSGKLVAPAFPFKGIIGKKELYAANGISLPNDLRGTVIQGYSVGNMTLSCARIYVTRILFVFNDGHFTIYPKEDDNTAATSLYPENALGYLSDTFGNTCLTGKYITDAPKVLANLALLGGISTGANAVASSQFTTVNNGDNLTSALTGSMPKLVGASMIGGGTQEILNWYKARVDDVFDAVYIPASFNNRPTDLVFNITKTIPIDLDKNGRTIDEKSGTLSNNFSRLD